MGYCTDTNPYKFPEANFQDPEKINVTAGILGNHIIAPTYLEENLTGVLYSKILQNFIHPMIPEIVANNHDEFENPHSFRPLKGQSHPRMVKVGAVRWSGLLVHPITHHSRLYQIKDYVIPPGTIRELMDRIIVTWASIAPETCQTFRNEF